MAGIASPNMSIGLVSRQYNSKLSNRKLNNWEFPKTQGNKKSRPKKSALSG
jgi:hypothetical protein